MGEIEDLEKKLAELKRKQLIPAHLREAKKGEWLSQGYDPKLVDMALTFADEWVLSLAKTYLPGKADMQKTMIELNYPRALDAAEKWLTGMIK